MPKIINKRIIVFLTITFMLGIFVGGLVFKNLALSIAVPLIALACGAVFYFFRKKLIVFVLFVAFVVGVGAFIVDYSINVKDINTNAVIAGRIEEVVSDKIVISNLTIDGKRYGGKLKLEYRDGSIGENIEYYGTIKTLDFSIFDTYSMSSYNDRIFYQSKIIYVKNISQGKLRFFEKVKAKISTILNKYMESEDAGIVKSLLFGDKSSLTNSDNVLIRNAGVSHIFAVSGLHVGFLVAIIIFLLRKLRTKPIVQLITVAIFVFVYGILCNFPSGLKRAGIMSLVFLLSNITCNKNDSLTTLSLSMLIILIFSPLEMFDLGFIMSVSAVLGIILFYNSIYKFLSFNIKNKLYLFVVASISLTLSANIFLFPICCNVFNTLSVYMLLSNLIIVPLVTISYSALIVATFLSLIYSGMGVFFYVLKYPVIAIRAVCKIIEALPFSTVSLPTLGIFTFSYILAFLVLSPIVMLKTRNKIISVGALSSLSILFFIVL